MTEIRPLRRTDHPDPTGLPPPEVKIVSAWRVSCDGGQGALGHPRVWLSIPHETGFVDCGYCDARFVHASAAPAAAGAAGPADHVQPADRGAPVRGPQPG
ncbi:zinc-finger domain-containing protein [Rubellimicrobium sp. CFH 75288]|nr:zinc-finger domain-containing protein [Rubellimicrobium sp. CFH 75288]NAZ37700.1 zinc-finger domain-containing protein [Rubellimicrobium sp. CFH 75288]